MSENKEKIKISPVDWAFRIVKGALIGAGAILPGVSGGALAAVFGLYEKIIGFLSNIRKDFIKNVLFFIPVGIGGLLGFFLAAKPLAFFMKNYEFQILWCFIGCILGTLPSLYKEAGKQGRKPRHLAITAVTAVLAFTGLWAASHYLSVAVPQNFWTWIMAGAIFALGIIVPGMSPSNFLIYFGMYENMNAGISDMNFGIIIPLGLGALICILLFAKLMEKILEKAYAGVFHFILGVVIASTAIIAPTDYSKATPVIWVISALLFVGGLALGLFMGWLEKKYKPAE